MPAEHKPKPSDTARSSLPPRSDQPQAPSSVRLASVHDEPVASPAQVLAAQLERELGAPGLPRRWPLAISAPLCFAASGLLWYGIIQAVLAVLRR